MKQIYYLLVKKKQYVLSRGITKENRTKKIQEVIKQKRTKIDQSPFNDLYLFIYQ